MIKKQLRAIAGRDEVWVYGYRRAARAISRSKSGVREAKKRVECKLEEELVDRLDRVAELLKTNRTEIIRTACLTYLKAQRKTPAL